MPLAFRSQSHGTVAFGFYNVETDGLLLDRLFFFCTDFCQAACALEAQRAAAKPTVSFPGYLFDDPAMIGDLMGAIHGVRHLGYLGEVYLRWPFPARPEEFRQRLDGAANREEAEAMLRHWARPETIVVSLEPGAGEVSVGPYVFSQEGYLGLLAYVWRGGYPTWEGFEDGRRPACVEDLVRIVPLAATGA